MWALWFLGLFFMQMVFLLAVVSDLPYNERDKWPHEILIEKANTFGWILAIIFLTLPVLIGVICHGLQYIVELGIKK